MMALLGVDLIILTVFTIIEQAGIGGELIRLTKSLEHTQDEVGLVVVACIPKQYSFTFPLVPII